jgi:hypothetical protein
VSEGGDARRVRPRPINVNDLMPIYFLDQVEAEHEEFPDSPTPVHERERLWRVAAQAASSRPATTQQTPNKQKKRRSSTNSSSNVRRRRQKKKKNFFFFFFL